MTGEQSLAMVVGVAVGAVLVWLLVVVARAWVFTIMATRKVHKKYEQAPPKQETVVYCVNCVHSTYLRGGDAGCWRKREYKDSDQYIHPPRDKAVESCKEVNHDGKCNDYRLSM